LAEHPKEGLLFYKAFGEIAEDRANIKKYDIVRFKSKAGKFFRLRIGKYRAIFEVNDREIKIVVIDIDKRGDIY